MPISVTGKTTGFLIGVNSHYHCAGAYRSRIAPEFANDLFGIKTNLNRIEQFFGLEESVYTVNLPDPRDSAHPHLIVAIGGDVNNVGTLREAIDRVREAGGAPEWTWYTVPTLADLRDRFHSPKNALSVAAILEMKYALGRLSNAGPVAVKYVGFRQHYIVPDREAEGIPEVEKGFRSLSVWPSGERFEPTAGQIARMPVLDLSGKCECYGRVQEVYQRRRLPTAYPPHPDAIVEGDYWRRYDKPGVTAHFHEEERTTEDGFPWSSIDRSAVNQHKSGYLGVAVFDTSSPSDAGADLEAIERAFPSLWEIGGVSGASFSGAGFEVGPIVKDEAHDWALQYAATATVGPVAEMDLFGVPEVVSGSWDLMTTQPAIGAYDLPGDPQTAAWVPGSIDGVQLNLAPYPESGGGYFEVGGLVNGSTGFQRIPVNFQRGATTSVPGASARGTATWWTSNLDPTTEGVDWDWGTPGTEAYRAKEVAAYEKVLENLFGGVMGQAWNGTGAPNRYVWARVSGYPGGEIMDLTLGANNGALLIANALDSLNTTPIEQPSLPADRNWVFSTKTGAASTGAAVQSRNVCNIGFPGYSGSGGQWLYWTGLIDEAGDSPLAEAVKFAS